MWQDCRAKINSQIKESAQNTQMITREFNNGLVCVNLHQAYFGLMTATGKQDIIKLPLAVKLDESEHSHQVNIGTCWLLSVALTAIGSCCLLFSALITVGSCWQLLLALITIGSCCLLFAAFTALEYVGTFYNCW